MTDAHTPPAHGAADPTLLFPHGEWEALRMQDLYAARVIVLLLLSIFIMGVIGYIGVCLWVA